MEDLLYNPVYHALTGADAHLGSGTATVRYFDEAVSPFVGFPTGYSTGFEELRDLLPTGRAIIYAKPEPIEIPAGWKQLVAIEGLQFVFTGKIPEMPAISPVPLDKDHVSGMKQLARAISPVPLDKNYVSDMIQLARLTKPGPFASRTIEFGHYHGLFENGQLAAMAGQRMHAGEYTEISAVCTHPDHLGKGYAAALLIHQLELIRSQGKRSFLHVRADNSRAIALYERLGFTVQRPMHFYFMEKI